MPESGRMGRAVDPVFAEVIDTLYGGALDAREAWDIVAKMMPDGADMHVPGNMSPGKKKARLAETRTGQALNLVAAAGGGHAAYLTGRDIVREAKKPKVTLDAPHKQLTLDGMPKQKLLTRAKTAVGDAAKSNRLLRPIAANPKRAALASLGAWGALHTSELVGDAIAGRSLHRQAKELKKALDDVVQARREQRITTEQALAIAEELVAKAWVPGTKARNLVNSQQAQAAKQGVKPNTVANAAKRGRRGLAVVGTAAAATGGVAAYRHFKPKVTSASVADDAIAQADHIATGGMSREHRTSLLTKRGGRTARFVSRIAAESSKASAAEAEQAAAHTIARAEKSAKKVAMIGGASLGAGLTAPVVAHQTLKSKLGKGLDTVWTGEISKVDTERRQVFGWCSLSQVDGQPVVDLQGDYVPLDEIEKAAYSYVLDSRKGGNMHEREGEAPRHVANLVESFVVTPEKLEQMGLAPDALPHGWWVGFKVDDDETWEQVKSGERAGFSIHGKGKRIEKMLGATS